MTDALVEKPINPNTLNAYDKLELSESLLAEIEAGDYICLVCAEEVDVKSQIWSCAECYRVYHLPCIKKWALKSLAYRDGSNAIKTWKCPSCSCQSSDVPEEYRCWCKRELNPVYDGLAPHSCGQTCAHPLGSCIHKCMAICHPGPHPQCTAMGPPIRCFCNKKSKQLPCIFTNYDGWSCGNVCGELLPCGVHRCQRKCHNGLCGDCDITIHATCYCGQTEADIVCSEAEPRKSEKYITVSSTEENEEKELTEHSWIGSFVCDKIETGKYDCGIHEYSLNCSKRTLDTYKCPKTPKDAETCPCGKSQVIDILGHPRSSCKEEIPTCGKVCDKKLKCGHNCLYPCHEGECPTCFQISKMNCRCGHNKFLVPCQMWSIGEKPVCARRCTGLLACRRHRCTKICCDFEKKAIKYEKNATWGKGYSVYDEDIEREFKQKHECTQPCNVLLNCGIHRCQKDCHVTPCGPCLESSSEDWVCPCGKTILRAPIRCGTILPTCTYLCTRSYPCGHTPPKHPCHSDDKPCDRCLKLVTKPCACGKVAEVANVPCYMEHGNCGQLCGKELPCGHKCSKICHEPGKCETKCFRSCKKELPCGHIHVNAKCHYPKSCAAVNARCVSEFILGCKCGTISKTVKCTGKAEERNRELLIPCEEACLDEQRRQQLAEAFGVPLGTNNSNLMGNNSNGGTKTPMGSYGNYSNHGIFNVDDVEYSDDLIDLYLSNPGWSAQIERQLKEFIQESVAQAAAASSSSSSTSSSGPLISSEKVLRFPPMPSLQRMFIHLLAEAYKLRSQSYDREPQRSVSVYIPVGYKGIETLRTARQFGSSAQSPIVLPRLTIGQYITKNNIS